MLLLSTAYFGNVQYFSKFLQGSTVYVEQHENYLKQSFRNRCEILTASGRQTLSIPIVRGKGEKIPIRQVRISYAEAWQQRHWRAITSAYNSSPFFEYYEDDLRPFFMQKEEFLFDLNTKITRKLLELLEIDTPLLFTETYEKLAENVDFDFRESISPKPLFAREDKKFLSQKYYQVFEQKFGFEPNLSVLDLLFNEGTEAKEVLEKCLLK